VPVSQFAVAGSDAVWLQGVRLAPVRHSGLADLLGACAGEFLQHFQMEYSVFRRKMLKKLGKSGSASYDGAFPQ
jgi:hypothetical protein